MDYFDVEPEGDLVGEVDMPDAAPITAHFKDGTHEDSSVTLSIMVSLKFGGPDPIDIKLKGNWGVFAYHNFLVKFPLYPNDPDAKEESYTYKGR